MPGYDGLANADDRLVQPWYIEGWTAQAAAADTIEVTTGLFTPAMFPAGLVYAEVTANYFDLDGSPLGGFLTLLMSDNVTITAGGNTYRLPARLAGMDSTLTGLGRANWGSGQIYIGRGQLAVGLLCTDNTGLTTDSGLPLTYWVTEHFLGGRVYQISVPSATVSPADINSLIVPGTVQPYSYDPVNPMGNMLAPVPPPGTVTTTQAPPQTVVRGVSYTQSAAASTWTITTNLGYNPGGITVIDGSGTIWMPESVAYPTVNQVVLTLAQAVAGTAYLS